jgi:hypothetical protein
MAHDVPPLRVWARNGYGKLLTAMAASGKPLAVTCGYGRIPMSGYRRPLAVAGATEGSIVLSEVCEGYRICGEGNEMQEAGNERGKTG